MTQEYGGKMRQEYRAGQIKPIMQPYGREEMIFQLNSEGKLNMIIFTNEFVEDEELIKKQKRYTTWGSALNEEWDFEEANEKDLLRAFEILAMKDSEEFKSLYFALKVRDSKTFPIIKEALENIRSKFNFY